ncbi:hypothetical protein [Archaeoglobus sp.]
MTTKDDKHKKLARLKREESIIYIYFGILKDSEVLEKILDYSKDFKKSAKV